MKQETWVNCTINKNYQVSSQGRVRRKEQVVRRGKSGKQVLKETILKPYLASSGYFLVSLGMRRTVSVHRIVAMAFVSGYKTHLDVNHKNGIRTDNTVENLEWVTRAENCLHSFRELGRKPSGSRPVIGTSIETKEERLFESARAAVREIGAHAGHISACCNNKLSKHKGYLWRFADA